MSRPRFTFSVFGHRADRTPERVATFFTFSDACDFVSENLGARNLYMSAPQEDRRKSGYRPAEKPSGYKEWLASLEPKELPNGRFQVAA